MAYKHKKDWFAKIDLLTSKEREETFVDCYSKPHGIFFEVEEREGVPVLRHHNRIYAEDPISTALVKAGYTGKIVVYGNMSNHQLPRWMGYQLINHKNMSSNQLQRWLSSITVYTFGPINGPVEIATQVLQPIRLAVNQVINFNRVRSQADDYDGVCFDYEGETHHILPSRSIMGEVRNVGEDTLIVLVRLPEGPRPIQVKYFGINPPPQDLIGKSVRVKYTERLHGRCMNNLMSATVIEDDGSV